MNNPNLNPYFARIGAFSILITASVCFFASCKKKAQETGITQETENTQQTTYTNPVVDRNFPDPTVVEADDGYFYVYATNSEVDGKTVNIQVQRSKDLVEWEDMGDALPEGPQWASSDFWAPHVSYNESSGRYLLYYSGESNKPNVGKCLGVAVAEKPEGPFVDKGEPLLCGKAFVNIDPMLFNVPDSGKKLLYWGSGHESIKVRELSEDGLDFKPSSEVIELVQPVFDDNLSSYEDLVEGAWVTKKNSYYYLFYSGDNCCGDQAHYAVMVARSKSPTGPFEKYNPEEGSVILSRSEEWLAPGHNSVIMDDAGDHWMVYHAIDTDQADGGRKMLIDKIVWKDGWPTIEGESPSTAEENAPVFN